MTRRVMAGALAARAVVAHGACQDAPRCPRPLQ